MTHNTNIHMTLAIYYSRSLGSGKTAKNPVENHMKTSRTSRETLHRQGPELRIKSVLHTAQLCYKYMKTKKEKCKKNILYKLYINLDIKCKFMKLSLISQPEPTVARKKLPKKNSLKGTRLEEEPILI